MLYYNLSGEQSMLIFTISDVKLNKTIPRSSMQVRPSLSEQIAHASLYYSNAL